MKSDFELKLPDLNLNDLLRSGFAGAFFILVVATSFNNPGQLLKDNKDVAGALIALGVPVSLTIGTVIYALHRAIPFPLFYCCLSFLVHCTKHKDITRLQNSMEKNSTEKNSFWEHLNSFWEHLKSFWEHLKQYTGTRELDITRWKHYRKENSLQRRLVEWASQIHFLYCLLWSSISALYLGDIFMWEQSSTYFEVRCLSIIFLLSAVFHHLRYLLWEKRVFEEDSNLMVFGA